MRRTFCFVVASAALVLASSCSEHALTPIGDSLVSEKIETSLPLGTNAVDILWLVDNSASMEAEQRELGARFDEFVAALADLQADFHMGVVTTDLNDPQRAGRFNVAPGNLISLGCSASAPELAYCADSAVDGAFLRRSSYGAAHERRQQTRPALPQAVDVSAHLVDPPGNLETKRDRYGLLAMGPTGENQIMAFSREACHRLQQRRQEAKEQDLGSPHRQSKACLIS